MDNLLKVLLEITVYSGIIFCALMLFKKAFKQKMSPALQSILWLLLIARLILPVTFESTVKLIRIPDAQDAVAQYTKQDAKGTEALPKESGAAAMEKIYSAESITPEQNIMQNEAEGSIKTSVKLPDFTWQQMALTVFVCGAGIYAAVLAVAGIRLRGKLNTAQRRTPKEIRELLEKCKERLSI